MAEQGERQSDEHARYRHAYGGLGSAAATVYASSPSMMEGWSESNNLGPSGHFALGEWVSGIFRRSARVSSMNTSRVTELDQDWFTAWADYIRAEVGNEQLRRQLQVSTDLDAFA